MQDIIGLVVGYLREVWSRRWLVVLVSVVVALAGWFVVIKLPDQYQASARFYVDTQTLLRPLLRGLTVQTNIDNQVNLIVKTLLSRPNTKKIALMADLDYGVDESNPEEFEALMTRLRKDIKLKGSKRENVYTVEYTNANSATAKNVVQSVLTVLVESSLGESREETVSAQRFIDQQLREYEKRLEEDENKLKEFKRKHAGIMPSSEGDYYQRLEAARAKYDSAKLELMELDRKHQALQRQLKGEEPSFGFTEKPAVSSISTSYDSRIASLEEQLDSLLLKYTAQHPDVKATREQLGLLKRARNKELAQLKQQSPSNSSSLDQNPVYQQLKVNLSEVEAEKSSMQVRVQSFKEKVDELEKMVNTIPEIEAQLIALNRGYQVTKRKYEDLLSRRESAQISRKASQATDDIQFKVIDPPHVPNEPVGPHRPLLMSVVFIFSIMLGLGVALLIALLKPSFTSKKILSDVTGLPVLGAVNAVVNDHYRHRQRLFNLTFTLTCIAFIASYASVMVLFH
ncbi:chain length-determining protein [Endozoicomonas sp. SM1973]|uniref:Chain length-determining protein n=1 Tax=Spartinivicinus marinus TaxID=2994442 RepID=A0A853IJ62_9GAMM|nr:XrtA system polysaccharide chain length determinant [Spartinivicinus marinus]MCX4024994.1 Wzz/FepE/Etk N-terminal domain-containing protein [Spartinivicinus marinus]NYZ67686.1 chain length-determining protein [Spartinivicinus marinus]